MASPGTTNRLMQVALNEFGEHGIAGASTRRIAAAAGTQMSAITYHYGGKEGLYQAVAKGIAENLSGTMAEIFHRAQELREDDSAGARAVLHALMDRFADKMMGDMSDALALFIVREQMHPGPAFEEIYGGAMCPMHEAMARMVCIATGQRDARRARIATVTLMGQALAFRASRASAVRLIGTPLSDPAVAAEIKQTLSDNLDAILDKMAAQPEPA